MGDQEGNHDNVDGEVDDMDLDRYINDEQEIDTDYLNGRFMLSFETKYRSTQIAANKMADMTGSLIDEHVTKCKYLIYEALKDEGIDHDDLKNLVSMYQSLITFIV